MAQSVPPERGVSQRIVFRCDLTEARDATRALRAFLAEQGLDESEQFNAELCLAEACNNAIQYATGAHKGHALTAEAICHSAGIELRVTDHTVGFTLGGKRTALDAQRENGRGLFIIQSLMDEVRYYRSQDGNILVMRKARTYQLHRPADAAVASLDSAREQLEQCQQTISGMARELCFRSESLSAIFRCCAELGRTSDLEGFGQRLMNDLLHLTTADWFVLRILPSGGDQLEVFAASFPALHHHALPFTAGETDSAELAAARTRREVEFDADLTTSRQEPLRLAGTGASGLVQPLLFGDQLLGTLALGRKNSDTPLSALQTEMIRTFAEFMAVQILNARHHEEQVHARLVAHELEIAHRIQRALLPRTLPALPGFHLAASWESARQVGGDFYDAIPIGDHAVLLVVADVMGKGVPAAIFATITRSLLRAMAVRSHHPARLLKRLNELLYTELSSVGMFITAQLVFVDLKRRHLVAASAGHCPVVIRSGDTIRTLAMSGTPLGILPDATYQQHSATLGTPGGLLLYTDGLTESQNIAGDMFGHDRLVEWWRARPTLGRAESVRDDLAAELTRFRGGAPLCDDQAVLILAENPAGSESPPSGPTPYSNFTYTERHSPELASSPSTLATAVNAAP
jgi:serine phosphatase RsbU (regulator of sigma subunit)/anti-sigma regulatory factor (Ser/Thr protein kinase)